VESESKVLLLCTYNKLTSVNGLRKGNYIGVAFVVSEDM